MVIIVNHAAAWAQAKAKYDFEDAETPKSFPVLLHLNIDDDGESMDTPVGQGVVTPEQAAKLLSICPEERILAIPQGIVASLVAVLGAKQNQTIKPKPLSIKGVDAEGMSMTLISVGSPSWKIGDVITVNNITYHITQVGTSIEAEDPITGIAGIQEVVEDSDLGQTTATFPGYDTIPIDPGKFQPKQKIADLGDDGHVLDVERAI